MDVLDALWGGNIRPCERAVRKGSEYEHLQNAAQKEHDRLWSMQTPEGKEVFESFLNANSAVVSISDKDFFVKGFRLGVQLILAAIKEDESQLPQL